MEALLLTNEFKENCLFRLDESLRMIEKSMDHIDEIELWIKPSPSLNSIGNLILHICGNMTQYVISGVGGFPDDRNRNMEFHTEGGFSKNELITQLTSTVHMAKEVIKKSDLDQLLPVRRIQGFEFSGVGALIHAVEHFSYHTGQIAFWVKYLTAKDLDFYGGIDLTQTNS